MSRPSPGNRWWTDLSLVVVLVVVAGLALLLPGVPWLVEWVLAVPFLLVLPGYALVSALLPASPGSTDAGSPPGPGWPTRLGLSLVLSVVIVGVLGVLLSRGVAIRLRPAVLGTCLVTVGCVVVAWRRRRRLPRERRAAPLGGGFRSLLRPRTHTSLQSVALALAVLALVGAATFAGATPSDRGAYSEFYLLAENERGELAASDLPRTFVAGEGRTLHVAIENHEHRPVSYELVAVARSDGPVPDRAVLDRFDVQLEHGERAVVERTVAPETAFEDGRLQFLLYEGDAPAQPDREAADAVLELGVDVVASPGALDGAGS